MKKKFYNYYVKRQYSSHLKDMIWKYHEKPIDSAYTPPNSWYIESQFYDEVELKHIFPKSWLLVGKKSDLANVGDYIAGNISKSPWVVINTGKGLKSFHNVCRHHAAQILDDGIGSINNPMKRLKCPYHGWQYTIDGKLAQANQMKGCSDFKAR
jgi:choline monooxygenase